MPTVYYMHPYRLSPGKLTHLVFAYRDSRSFGNAEVMWAFSAH